MITLRRSDDRRRDQRGKSSLSMSFYADDDTAMFADGFGNLERFDESHLRPRGASRRVRSNDRDTVTYVRRGALVFANATGYSGVVQAGEFLRVTAANSGYHRETNASHRDSAQVFHIGLHCPALDHDPSHEQQRFPVAERRGRLIIVASPDARCGSLLLHQDALVHSAILYAGQHVVHEIARSRSAWLHLVDGEAMLGDIALGNGDGAALTSERAVSLTAVTESEVLLVDLGPRESIVDTGRVHV